MHDPAVSQSKPLKGEREALTPRELEVLQLICAGKSNREIAATLDLSINTVSVHRSNIMERLGAHNVSRRQFLDLLRRTHARQLTLFPAPTAVR